MHLSFIRDTRYTTINFIRYLGVLIQELDIDVGTSPLLLIRTFLWVIVFLFDIDQIFLVNILEYTSELQAWLTAWRGVDEEKRLLVDGLRYNPNPNHS